MKIVYAVEAGALLAYGSVFAAAGALGIGDGFPVWLSAAFFAGAAVCFLCVAMESRHSKGFYINHHKNTKKKPDTFQVFDLREEWSKNEKTD